MTGLTLALALLLSPMPPPVGAPVAAVGRQQPARVNPDAKELAEFKKRAAAYSAMHRNLESTLPDLPTEATPEQIENHQMGLAQLITRQRSNAKVGDIFTKSTRSLFRRFLAGAFSGPDGPDLKAAIMEENPGKIRFSVNGRYPESVPIVSVPPKVLEALPELPSDLEYRFVGTTLILLDIHAQIIVDLIENAIPR